MLQRRRFHLDELVNTMLDALPAEIWTSSTTTFLDPSIGGGQFVAAIERRLAVAGHSTENIKNRVFGFESSTLRVRAAVGRRKLKGTYTKSDFINDDINMKFDVIVGNPPYQSNNGSGNISGSGPKALWAQFLSKVLPLLKDNGILSLITPNGLFCSSNEKFNQFKGENIAYNITHIIDTTKYFNVGTNTTAFILHNKKYEGTTLVDGNPLDLSLLPVIPSFGVDIYSKVIANKNGARLNFNTQGQLVTKVKSEVYSTETPYAYNANGKIFYSNMKSKSYNNPKVMMGQLESTLNPIYSDKMSNTPSTMRMLVSSESEGRALISILNTKLYTFLINSLKVSSRLTWAINSLPLLDLSKDWTDQEVYEYFNLTQDEINYIEENV